MVSKQETRDKPLNKGFSSLTENRDIPSMASLGVLKPAQWISKIDSHPFRDSFLAQFSSSCESDQMLKQKDVPQSISGRDELGKDELHNVLTVTAGQGSLQQRQTQVEGERRRTIGFKRAGCAISGF